MGMAKLPFRTYVSLFCKALSLYILSLFRIKFFSLIEEEYIEMRPHKNIKHY